jgi:hypothetical protein
MTQPTAFDSGAFFINLKYLGLEGPLAPGRLGQPLPGTKYKNAFLPKKSLDHEAVFRATMHDRCEG